MGVCVAAWGAFYCVRHVADPPSNLLPSLFAVVGASGLFLGLLCLDRDGWALSVLLEFSIRAVGATCAFFAAGYALDLGSLNPCVLGGDANYSAVVFTFSTATLIAVLAVTTAPFGYSLGNFKNQTGPNAAQ